MLKNEKIADAVAAILRKNDKAYVTFDCFNRPIRVSEYAPGSWMTRTDVITAAGDVYRY